MPVFCLTMETGFFSSVFRLCTAWLRYGPDLGVDSSEWTYGRWSWFFQSLDERRDSDRLTLQSVADDTETWTLGDYRRVLRTLLQPTAQIRVGVRDVLREIGEPFLAVFVRRGDKVVREAPLIPMSTILSWIPIQPGQPVFIQTDDYTVVEEARACLPTHRIFATVSPTKRGSYHSAVYGGPGVPWTEKSPEDAKAETLEMLIGLFVCLRAESCWTDETSNVGRWLALHGERVHTYPDDRPIDESLHVHPAWTLRG